MLKIKDKLGKLIALLKDDASEPTPTQSQHGCCERCECCCEEGRKTEEVTENKEKE